MTSADLLALLPLLVACAAPPVAMILSAATRSVGATSAFAAIAMLAAALGAIPAAGAGPRDVTGMLASDAHSLAFVAILALAAAAVALLGIGYLRGSTERRGDRFPVLVLFAAAGMLVAASASHFATFFVGLEIYSVALYGLLGFEKARRSALEAGMKYLVLAATSSAFLLFGMAVVYAGTGEMAFGEIGRAVAAQSEGVSGGVALEIQLGVALMLVGFGFKLALAPAHLWSPDVFQGAPTPAAALLATGSKGAVLAVLARFLTEANLLEIPALPGLLALAAALTMTVGNVAALGQVDLKRMLAFSSVAHMGYALLALLSSREGGVEALAFYLAAYVPSVLVAFGVLCAIAASGRRAERFADLAGMRRVSPIAAVAMAVALVSLTGLPLTGGFLAKILVFRAALGAGWAWLVLLAVANSALSAVFYFRAIFAMGGEEAVGATSAAPLARGCEVVLGGLAALVVAMGVAPGPILELARAAAAALLGG